MAVMIEKQVEPSSWRKNRPSPWSPSSPSQLLHLVVLGGYRDRDASAVLTVLLGHNATRVAKNGNYRLGSR